MIEYVSVSAGVEHTSWRGCWIRRVDRNGIDGDVIIRSKDGWDRCRSDRGQDRRIERDRGIMGSGDHLVIHPIIIGFED
jgi:hypothetical protein